MNGVETRLGMMRDELPGMGMNWYECKFDAIYLDNLNWFGHRLGNVEGSALYRTYVHKCEAHMGLVAAASADGFTLEHSAHGRIDISSTIEKFDDIGKLKIRALELRDSFMDMARKAAKSRKAVIQGMKDEAKEIFGGGLSYKAKNTEEVIVYSECGKANAHIRKTAAANAKDGEDIYFVQANLTLNRAEMDMLVELFKRKALLHKMREVQ